jgi:hypothetical protein
MRYITRVIAVAMPAQFITVEGEKPMKEISDVFSLSNRAVRTLLMSGGAVFLITLLSLTGYAQSQDTGIAGDGIGGQPYLLPCEQNEALVGLAAYGGMYVNMIKLKCVKIDKGKWVGDVVTRGYTGGPGGQPADLMCSRDTVVSGFKGKAGTYVDQ